MFWGVISISYRRREMKLVTRVQILEETVLLHANTFGKGTNTPVLPPAIDE